MYRLFYIREPWAWFTDGKLEDVGGDDFNDAPYEHNASGPYEWAEFRNVPEYSLLRIAFDSEYDTPAERNISVSVDAINRGDVAWLAWPSWSSDKRPAIQAGTSLEQFKSLIRESGGSIFVEELGQSCIHWSIGEQMCTRADGGCKEGCDGESPH